MDDANFIRQMVQIVKLNTDPRIRSPKVEVCTDPLGQVLCEYPDVEEIMVVAIMGAARTGKSFMINLIASYLSHLMENDTDDKWLESEELLHGADWCQSRDSVTKGIWLWKSPFILTQDGGRKVKVLLIDCQGTHDKEDGTKTVNLVINSMGLRISTVHLFNVIQCITTVEAEALKDCISYMELHQKSSTSRNRAFNSLITVHRDWQADDKLGYRDGVPSLASDICGEFRNPCSFMLPNPGVGIRTGSVNMKLSIKELYAKGKDEEKFFLQARDLCRRLFYDVKNGDAIISERHGKVTVPECDLISCLKSMSSDKVVHVISLAEGIKFPLLIEKCAAIEQEYCTKIAELPIKSFKCVEDLRVEKGRLGFAAYEEFQRVKRELKILSSETSLTTKFNYLRTRFEKEIAATFEIREKEFEKMGGRRAAMQSPIVGLLQKGQWLYTVFTGREGVVDALFDNDSQLGILMKYSPLILCFAMMSKSLPSYGYLVGLCIVLIVLLIAYTCMMYRLGAAYGCQ